MTNRSVKGLSQVFAGVAEAMKGRKMRYVVCSFLILIMIASSIPISFFSEYLRHREENGSSVKTSRPGTIIPGESPPVRDGPGDTGDDKALLSGLVLLNGTESPVAGAVVEITNRPFENISGDPLAAAKTDMMGYFQFRELYISEYWLKVSKQMYFTHTERISVSTGDPRVLIVNLTANGTDLPTIVEGRVVDGSTGVALKGAKVTVGGVNATTKSDGFYRIYNLEPGSHTGTAEYSKGGYMANYTVDTRTNISVKADSLTRQDFIVTPSPGSLLGTLKWDGSYGTWVENTITNEMAIVLTGETEFGSVGPYFIDLPHGGTRSRGRAGRASQNAYFEFIDMLPPADYTLTVDHFKFKTYKETFTLEAGRMKNLYIELEPILCDLEFDLDIPMTKAELDIEVQCRDFFVIDHDEMDPYQIITREFIYTKQNQSLVFEDVPVGNYHIEITDGHNGGYYPDPFQHVSINIFTGNQSVSAHRIVMAPNNGSFNATFEMERDHRSLGYTHIDPVTDGTITLIGGESGTLSTEFIWDLEDSRYFPRTTFEIDDEGAVRVAGIPEGWYEYRIEVPGLLDKTGDIRTDRDDRITHIPNLVQSASVKVRSQGSREGYVKPYTLRLIGKDVPGTFRKTLPSPYDERDGDPWEALFFEVPNGNYTLKVSHPWFDTYSEDIELNYNEWGDPHKRIRAVDVGEPTNLADVSLHFTGTVGEDTMPYIHNNVWVQSQWSGSSSGYPPTTDAEGYLNTTLPIGKVKLGISEHIEEPDQWVYHYEYIDVGAGNNSYDFHIQEMGTDNKGNIWGYVFTEAFAGLRHGSSVSGKYFKGVVPNAKITVNSGDGSKTVNADSDGFFSFDIGDLDNFESITFRDPGSGLVPYFITNPPHYGKYYEIPLYGDGSNLSLTVVADQDGEQLSDADVSFGIYSGTTNENGSYKFTLLPKGEFELRVEKPGFFPLTQKVKLGYGKDKELEVELIELPPPEIISVEPAVKGDVFIADIDYELEFEANIRAGHTDDPIVRVEFSLGDHRVDISQSASGSLYTAKVNMGDLELYPAVHYLTVEARSKYGYRATYKLDVEYKVIKKPDWAVSLYEYIEGNEKEIANSFIKTRLHADRTTATDPNNYLKYSWEVGYEFRLEMNGPKVFANYMNWDDPEAIWKGISFNIEFSIDFISSGVATGGGQSTYNYVLPFSQNDMDQLGLTESMDLHLKGDGALDIEVDINFDLNASSGTDMIEVTEVRLGGEMSQGVWLSIPFNALIEWMGKVFAVETMGLSMILSKVLNWLMKYVVTLSANLEIVGSLDLDMVVDTTSPSTLFPGIPFSWESGEGTFSMLLKAFGRADVGPKGYIGCIDAGFEIEPSVSLGFPDPYLRSIMLEGRAFASGFIAWWRMPDDADIPFEIVIYDLDRDEDERRGIEGEAVKGPVYTRSRVTPIAPSDMTVRERYWLTSENFTWSPQDNSEKVLEDTSPFASPAMAVDAGGNMTVAFVKDNADRELPKGLGISSLRYDSMADRWTEGPWLSNDGYCSYSPTIAYDTSGNAMAVWCSYKDTNLSSASHPYLRAMSVELRSAVYSASAGEWSEPQWITSNHVQELEPRLTYDPSGRYVLMWREDRDMNPGTTHDGKLKAAVHLSGIGWRRVTDPGAGNDLHPEQFALDAEDGRILIGFIDGDRAYLQSYNENEWSNATQLGDGDAIVRISPEIISLDESVVCWVENYSGDKNDPYMHHEILYARIGFADGKITVSNPEQVAANESICSLTVNLDNMDRPLVSWLSLEKNITRLKTRARSGQLWGEISELLRVEARANDADMVFLPDRNEIFYYILGWDDAVDISDPSPILYDLWSGKVSYQQRPLDTAERGELSVNFALPLPATSGEGEPVEIVGGLSALGIAAATSVRVSLAVDETIHTSRVIDLVEGDSTMNITFTWYAKVGEHELTIFADSLNQISETDEGDNQVAGTIVIEQYAGPPGVTIDNAPILKAIDGDDEDDERGPDEHEGEDDSGSNALFAIIASAIVVLIVILLIFYRRKERKKEMEYEGVTTPEEEGGEGTGGDMVHEGGAEDEKEIEGGRDSGEGPELEEKVLEGHSPDIEDKAMGKTEDTEKVVDDKPPVENGAD